VFAHVRQPNDYTCAPAVVAIVTGAPLDELIREMRPTPTGGSSHRKLIKALRARGVLCSDRFEVVSKKRPLPRDAIVRISFPHKDVGHVIVKHGDVWFDPVEPWPYTCSAPLLVCGRVTSSLWISRER
jgi:hypothetical protein